MPSKFIEIVGCDMDLLCPEKWEALTPTDDESVRQCTVCSQSVTFCTDQASLDRFAAVGQCVAYEV